MMKKQNKIYLTIGIVVVVLLVAITMFSTPKGEDTINIGSILSLTGAASSWVKLHKMESILLWKT